MNGIGFSVQDTDSLPQKASLILVRSVLFNTTIRTRDRTANMPINPKSVFHVLHPKAWSENTFKGPLQLKKNIIITAKIPYLKLPQARVPM